MKYVKKKNGCQHKYLLKWSLAELHKNVQNLETPV